jgi:hypothetical protein
MLLTFRQRNADLISNFLRVLNVVFFPLGGSPACDFKRRGITPKERIQREILCLNVSTFRPLLFPMRAVWRLWYRHGKVEILKYSVTFSTKNLTSAGPRSKPDLCKERTASNSASFFNRLHRPYVYTMFVLKGYIFSIRLNSAVTYCLGVLRNGADATTGHAGTERVSCIIWPRLSPKWILPHRGLCWDPTSTIPLFTRVSSFRVSRSHRCVGSCRMQWNSSSAPGVSIGSPSDSENKR